MENTYLIAIVNACWFHAFVSHEQVAFYILLKMAEKLLATNDITVRWLTRSKPEISINKGET